eukprot:4380729-Prymnesium_polylepis.1
MEGATDKRTPESPHRVGRIYNHTAMYCGTRVYEGLSVYFINPVTWEGWVLGAGRGRARQCSPQRSPAAPSHSL